MPTVLTGRPFRLVSSSPSPAPIFRMQRRAVCEEEEEKRKKEKNRRIRVKVAFVTRNADHSIAQKLTGARVTLLFTLIAAGHCACV